MELLINCFDWMNFLIFAGVVSGATIYLAGVLWFGNYLDKRFGEWTWIPVLIFMVIIPSGIAASILGYC